MDGIAGQGLSIDSYDGRAELLGLRAHGEIMGSGHGTHLLSSLLQLFPSEKQQEIQNDDDFRNFTKVMADDGKIKRLHHTLLDIEPIKDYLRRMGPNKTMSLTDLTTKVCFLLSLCGIMRADDLACTDAEKCTVTCAEVTLTVIIPKEKRGGQRIEKSVLVTANSEETLCPV
ncbi:hypothetical protein BGZ83_003029 [Gryganskiella cystojenkinii]|nr:hypothetical protein BGZ83_003029 [Gryganskiella cystojenkinii]